MRKIDYESKFSLKRNFSVKTLLVLLVSSFPVLLQAQDITKLYQVLNPSVLTIQTVEAIISDGAVAQGGGLGTGVLIDSQGLVMTAAHVVASADLIYVKTYDDQIIEAEVISSVSSADVALLKLKRLPKNIPVVKLGNSSQVEIGEQIMVIGSPYGLEHSLSIGHISGKQKRGMILAGEEMEFLQIDAAINQGNSGGPVFNMRGELIGIVSSILSKSGRFEGFGFAASISPAKKILLEGSPFWTGFEGIFINGRLAATFNVTSGAGVLVQRVVSNSVADKAGLRGGQIKATILGSEIWIGGDIILSIHNTICSAPHNFEDIKAQLDELAPGETINMKVLREGKVVELSMIFN